MEAARVAALRSYGVLNHSPAPKLAELCAAAASALDAAVACISFIDADRHWTKASTGSDPMNFPRYLSFCHHTIHEPSGTLVVPDMVADARFSAHPSVYAGPRYRFYAGASVVDPGEYRIGALCVLDTQPRHLDSGGLDTLRRLSQQVMDALLAGEALGSSPEAGRDPDAPPVQGWLGVRTERAVDPHGVGRHGLLLLSVAQPSPAERAGLEVGDVLVAIGDHPTLASGDIAHALSNRVEGDALPVHVWRAGRAVQRTIHIEAMPEGRRTRRKL
jgi:PDZ domain